MIGYLKVWTSFYFTVVEIQLCACFHFLLGPDIDYVSQAPIQEDVAMSLSPGQ